MLSTTPTYLVAQSGPSSAPLRHCAYRGRRWAFPSPPDDTNAAASTPRQRQHASWRRHRRHAHRRLLADAAMVPERTAWAASILVITAGSWATEASPLTRTNAGLAPRPRARFGTG